MKKVICIKTGINKNQHVFEILLLKYKNIEDFASRDFC